MSVHLGKISFLDIPDVNGVNLLPATGISTITADAFSARPAAAVSGRLFLDTTNNVIYRDNGSGWDLLSPAVGTDNQIITDGSKIGLANNPVIPGSEGITIPNGTTAQRVSNNVGQIRYNTSNTEAEVFSGGNWLPLGKLIQSQAGNIAPVSGASQKANTTVPTTSEGISVFSTTFTPKVIGSSIVVQYTYSAYHGTAGRTVFTSLFANTTCIGLTTDAVAVASGAATLTMQAVVNTTSLNTLTISCRAGTLNGTGTLYVNQTPLGVTYGNSLTTEYRILELI
jgi:hypothetical protein